jgi:hypothetical protein
MTRGSLLCLRPLRRSRQACRFRRNSRCLLVFCTLLRCSTRILFTVWILRRDLSGQPPTEMANSLGRLVFANQHPESAATVDDAISRYRSAASPPFVRRLCTSAVRGFEAGNQLCRDANALWSSGYAITTSIPACEVKLIELTEPFFSERHQASDTALAVETPWLREGQLV